MNANTISVQLIVNDDGSVVMKQFGKNSEEALGKVSSAAPKATSALDSLKSSYFEMAAKAAMAYMAVVKAMDYMNEGAKALQVESSFKIMADSAGANADKMIASMKEATKGTIEDSALMQKAVKMMTLGFDPAQIERFSKVVITASQVAGISSAEAYDRLADAISTRMPRALIGMGAITKDQIKIVTEAINAGADSTVFAALALANLELETKKLQGTQDGATLAMQRFKAQAQQTKEEIGSGLLIIAQKLYAAFQDIGVVSLTASGSIYKLFQGLATLESKLSSGDHSKQMAQLAEQYKSMAASDFNAAADLAEKASANLAGVAEVGKKAIAQEIADAQKKVNAQMAAMKAFATAAKDTKDILAAVTEENKKVYDAAIEAADHAEKMQVLAGQNELNFTIDTINKKEIALNAWHQAEGTAINAYVKDEREKQAKLNALNQDYFGQWQKYEDKKQEEGLKTTAFLLEANASMLKDINEYSQESTDYQIALIQKKALVMTIAGQNEVLVAKWVKDQISNISGDGWTSGMTQWDKALGNEFTQMQDLAKTTATSMSKSFSDLFFDVAKGQTKDFYTYFQSFMDAMLRKVTDNMANMVTQWILGTNQMKAASGGGSLGSLLNGAGDMIGNLLPDSFLDMFGSVVPVLHDGGIVGDSYAPKRMMPALAFAGAPRFHSGLASDEIPAILQRGEAVIPRNQVQRSGSSGGNNETKVINYFYCIDSKSTQDFVTRNAAIFQNINLQGLRDNKTRVEMKKLLS